MTMNFFPQKRYNDTINNAAIKVVELSDEQLKQVTGGYIVNTPQGELDWQKRQQYQKTHPGTVIPF